MAIDETHDFEPLFARARSDGDSKDDEMDMTPMVDITFLLLIFFMITAAFALQKAIEVPPMDSDEASQAVTVEDLEKDSVVVRVDGENIYWVGAPLWADEQRAISEEEMRSRLREARQGKGGKFGRGPSKMLIQAHGDATHERVVFAMDAGASVGMEEIRLMSYEEGDL